MIGSLREPTSVMIGMICLTWRYTTTDQSCCVTFEVAVILTLRNVEEHELDCLARVLLARPPERFSVAWMVHSIIQRHKPYCVSTYPASMASFTYFVNSALPFSLDTFLVTSSCRVQVSSCGSSLLSFLFFEVDRPRCRTTSILPIASIAESSSSSDMKDGSSSCVQVS